MNNKADASIASFATPNVWVSSEALRFVPVERRVLSNNSVSWGQDEWQKFAVQHDRHRLMLQTLQPNDTFSPLVYMQVQEAQKKSDTSNSIFAAENAPIYAQISSHLRDLRQSGEPMEEGAIDTALIVLEQLEQHNLVPPLVTPQGDDAVVMLWSIRGSTYAITVTDGEIGYVVRQNKQQIKKIHSVKVDKMDLAALQ